MSWLVVVRDLLIILVAVASLVAIAVWVYAGFQVYLLVKTLKGQVPPLFTTVKQTAGTVEGTVTFMSQRAVTPVVRYASITAAVLRFLQVLFRGSGRRP